MTFTKLRWERRSGYHICHLPFAGVHLELAQSVAPPGATASAPSRPRLWARVVGGGAEWPSESWFPLTDQRGGFQRWVDRVENAGGLIGAIPELRADFWEGYAHQLEQRLHVQTYGPDGPPGLPEPMVPRSEVQDDDW